MKEIVPVISHEETDQLICSCFSKTFGLDNERTGALTATAATKDASAAVGG